MNLILNVNTKDTKQFRKDYKLASKRGLNIKLLQEVINSLLREEKLASQFCDHALTGKYIGFRECHIQADWLLIYFIDSDKLILTATRTGTHADLFNK